jgi:hypothetical protein
LFTGASAPPSQAEASPQRTGSAAAPRPRNSSTRAADDVLLRLDQALGRIPEVLVPLRIRAPVVVRHTFEAPCSRPEVISHVCSDMVDRLMDRLSRRRESLRSAAWSFVHADLPADLSTDLPVVALPGGRELHAEHASRMPVRSSREPPVSSITLGLASPTPDPAHVWSVLRARLEQLALDHGIERIECRAERTARMRFRQERLDERSGGSVSSDGFESAAVAPGEVQQARAAWIDLVRSRLGASAVQHPSVLVEHDDEPPDAHHPHVLLHAPEPACLHGGADAWAIAHCIATRTSWRRESPAAPVEPAAASREPCGASLAWRGARWPIDALDGWERRQPAWWKPREEASASSRRTATSRHALHPLQLGGVFSRLAIVTCSGRLWIWVRWPDRLAPVRSSVAPHAHPAIIAERFDAGVLRWLEGGRAALSAGVDMEIRGMWS